MPCRYFIDKKRRLVINFGWDRLTFAEMQSQQSELLHDPNFDPTFNQLVDVSGVTILDMSVQEAKRIAVRGIYSPTSRRAVIATNPVVFGMGRMMDVHHSTETGRENVAVFSDRKSALEWLGLEDEGLEDNLRL